MFSQNNTMADRFARVIAWAIPFVILGMILWLRPGWGLMDDVTNVFTMVPKMREQGSFQFGWVYAMGDIHWGMFRPLYPPMVHLIYFPGMATTPWVSFAWNALLVCVLAGMFAWVLARILKLSTATIVLAMGAFFYGHDLFQHLSLQEKHVMLAGLACIWLFWNRPRLSAAVFWPLALVCFVFGACAKASFAIHYSVAVWAFVATNAEELRRGKPRAWLETSLVLASLVILVLVFAYISRQGSYTAAYSSSKIIPNLLSAHGPFLLLPVVAALAWALLHWREVWARPELLLPAIGVSAYLAIFLPWGIGGYVQSLVTPFYAALIIQLGVWYLGALPRAVWLVPLAVLSLAVTTYRSFANFGRLGDVHRIVAAGPQLEARGVSNLWMPCNEGSLSMDRFFREAGSKITVSEQLPSMPAKGKILLYDQSMCPLPARAVLPVDCGENEILFPGSFAKSYRVLRCR